MVPKAVEAQPACDCMRSLMGDRMSIKMYEQNIARASRARAVQRAQALSRRSSREPAAFCCIAFTAIGL